MTSEKNESGMNLNGVLTRLTLDVDTLVRVLLQRQPLLGVLPQQVSDLLVVNLQVGRVHEVLGRLGHGDGLEDVFEGARYDPTLLAARRGDALHGEALAAAGLSVGEHGAVVTFQHALSGTLDQVRQLAR